MGDIFPEHPALPLDLLPLIVEHLVRSQAQATLAIFCRLDKSTRGRSRPSLYRTIRLASPQSIAAFLAIFSPSVPSDLASSYLEDTHHLEIELDDTYLQHRAFTETLGYPFGTRPDNTTRPHGLFPRLQTLHITTYTTQEPELSIHVSDPPSLPVLVARLLSLAKCRHLRWKHCDEKLPRLSPMEEAAWLSSAQAALVGHIRDGAISQEVPPDLGLWEAPIRSDLRFVRVDGAALDWMWARTMREMPRGEEVLVVYVDCLNCGIPLEEGRLELLKGLEREGLIRWVQEEEGPDGAEEWREWVRAKPWKRVRGES